MSKLSLSKRLASREQPQTFSAFPSGSNNSNKERETPDKLPAPTEPASSSDGWSSDGEDDGAIEKQEEDALKEHQSGSDDGLPDDPPNFEFEDLYGGPDNDFYISEEEEDIEQQKGSDGEERSEREAAEEQDIIDLCDSDGDGDHGVQDSDEEQEPQQQQQRCCQVCGVVISEWHYLQQVQHVKQCLTKRHLQGGSGRVLQQPQNASVEQAPGQQGSTKRKLLDVDIRDWLKELGLEAHIETFIAEEIDMSIVHALDESDLRFLGIDDLMAQRRFLSAAKKVGEEVAAAKRPRISERQGKGSGRAMLPKPAPQNGVQPPAGQKKEKKQQTLQLVRSNTGNALSTLNAAKRNGASVQSKEQSLLSSLYPESSLGNATMVVNNQFSHQQQQRQGGTDIDMTNYENIELTPPLPAPNALASYRVASGASLFTSAARCEQVTTSLQSRIDTRLAAKESAVPEPLGRGGVTFSHNAESKALKAMKLEALKEELRTHETTVTELKRLIADLEKEIDT